MSMVGLEDLLRGTCWWMARSGWLPSSRVGLFAIGELFDSSKFYRRYLLLLGVGITVEASDSTVLTVSRLTALDRCGWAYWPVMGQ